MKWMCSRWIYKNRDRITCSEVQACPILKYPVIGFTLGKEAGGEEEGQGDKEKMGQGEAWRHGGMEAGMRGSAEDSGISGFSSYIIMKIVFGLNGWDKSRKYKDEMQVFESQ